MTKARPAENAGKTSGPSRAPKRAWTGPTMRRLKAGAAETAGAVSDDGVIGNS